MAIVQTQRWRPHEIYLLVHHNEENSPGCPGRATKDAEELLSGQRGSRQWSIPEPPRRFATAMTTTVRVRWQARHHGRPVCGDPRTPWRLLPRRCPEPGEAIDIAVKRIPGARLGAAEIRPVVNLPGLLKI
jgi:hypothetical protein